MSYTYAIGNNSTRTSYYPNTNGSRIRFIHNVAGGPQVDIYVDNKLIASNVPYKTISDYIKLQSGPHQLNINASNTGDAILSSGLNLESGQDYTIIVQGSINTPASLNLFALKDNNSCPQQGKSHIRFIHSAPGAPSVDVYANNITSNNNGQPGSIIFSNVKYGSVGNPTYLPVDSGIYNVAVTPTGRNNIVVGPVPLRLEQGKVYTIIASGLINNMSYPLTALVSEDNSGMCLYL